MGSETILVRKIMLALSKAGAICWRNNQGGAWAGSNVVRVSHPCTIMVNPGDVVVRQARPIKVGLVTGAGDLIGYIKIRITPEMVGCRAAVFASWEVKTPKGRPSADQRHFAGVITAAGGMAAIVRSEDEAVGTVASLMLTQ